MPKKYKIIFFGSFLFAVAALERLIKDGCEISAVVTNPDAPQGRQKRLTPGPVKTAAQKLGLPVFQPSSLRTDQSVIRPTLDPGFALLDSPLSRSSLDRRLTAREFSSGYMADLLQKIKSADLAVVVAYGKILPKEIVDLPKYGTLNIHPSLLPVYRGPSPVQTAILNGETETGVTIIQIDEEVDHGPILSQAKYAIPANAYYPQVTQELFELGADLLIKTIPDWLEGKIIPQPQEHSRATFTKKFSREDGRIDWKQPAEKIYNQIRALNPEPGTWTTFNGKILKILKVLPLHQDPTLMERALILPVIPQEVQLEGKRPMSFQDFLRGIGGEKLNFE